MKNKHLLMLFLATLAVGYLARQAPLPFRRNWSGELVQLDTSTVRQFTVQRPGETELVFERTDAGWTVAREHRAIALAPGQIEPLLGVFALVRSVKLIRSERPDTLGLDPANALHIVVYDTRENVDEFWLGREVPDGPGGGITYFRPAHHDGLYAVEGLLRARFDVSLDDFRDPTVFILRPAAVQAVALAWRDHPPLYLLRRDSTAAWPSADGRTQQPDSTVRRWLGLLQRLSAIPPADYFDESRAGENYLARISLESARETPLVLRFYHVAPPEAPDDVGALRASGQRLFPYVLESSQRPGSFFAVEDTALAREICFGLLPGRDSITNRVMK